MAIKDFYVWRLVFLRLLVSNYYVLGLVFLCLRVKHSYVWGLVFLRLGASNSYVWRLQICKFSQFLNISECSELPEECSKIVNGFFVKEYKSNVMY